MTQEQSARLLPQKPSRWAKILLNRKVPILLFFLLELAFLVFSYLSLQEHFPSIILWEHLLSVFTFFLLAQSFHGFSFQTVLGDYHLPSFQFLGRLCFTFHWLIWVSDA